MATLVGWLRAVLSQHAAYLMACPQLLPMLTPLYQVRVRVRVRVRVSVRVSVRVRVRVKVRVRVSYPCSRHSTVHRRAPLGLQVFAQAGGA